MKKALVLFFGLLLISALGYAQQDKEPKSKEQSLTITIAPSFFATMDEKLNGETFWPNSLYVTKNFMLKKRLSLSTGVHLLYKKIIESGFVISDWGPGYSGPTKTTYVLGVFDIPLRLNYHIIKPNDKINLYAKTEIKNSLVVNYLKGEPNYNGKNETNTEFGYNMFLGIGFGLDFRVADRLYFVIEPGLNYSVLGYLPDVGLVDCQFGVRYDLFK